MLWPRTLFGRMVLIFSGMMVLSYIATIVLFLAIFIKPIAISTSTYLSQQATSIHTALQVMSESQKQIYLTSLAVQENILLYSNTFPSTMPGEKAGNDFQKVIAQQLRRQISQALEVRFQFGPERRIVWLNFDPNKTSNWLGVKLSKGPKQFPASLKAQLLVILILTIIGAAVIAYRLNRPIKQLVKAAHLLGQGSYPEPLIPHGPKELRELCETFNSMVRDISKLAEDRNLILAGISHDLRTPLSRMRLAVEMLDDKVEADLQQGMVHDLDDMDRILGQFIAYSKEDIDEASQLDDLNALVEDIAENYTHQNKSILLDLTELPSLRYKPIAMRRLLINLVDNAWHYARPPIEIHTRVEGELVYLCVLDRGPGIAQSDVDQLCQPFARLEKSRSDGLRAGLGLAIVQRVAMAHQAEVLFSNRRDGGLEVCVKLPVNS